MSRRTLGNGRVLGSGRTVGPASSKSSTPLPDRVLSPSNSSLSLNNSGSGHSTPPSSEPQDIASRVSLDHGGPTTLPLASTTGDRLACPICNEEMVTLLQLNRHLDDAHKEIQVEQQDEVKDWFDRQVAKAKKFQPLAVLNQKLKGLDVFESNNDIGRSTTIPRHEAPGPARTDGPSSVPSQLSKAVPTVDPDEVISKSHWQKKTGNDVCSDPACGRRLGATSNGIVNCRHCGKLFCEEHTMYQMKLSRSAQHEPVRGLWCRVCETCYKSREGYNDRHGLERSRISDFAKIRQQTFGQRSMEVSRLEKRLSRLTQLLANPSEDPYPSSRQRWSLTSWGQNDTRKALEQTIVSWQDDAEVSRCPYCQQDFSQYTFRRHHCRTCGKVVCGDPATGCSTILALNVATKKPPPQDTVALDIRLCKECNHKLFSKADFEASRTSPATESFTRSYRNLLEFERGIRLLLPKFQRLLQALQSSESPPTSQQITDASRTRKRLMDAFTQYDTAARRIRDTPSPSPTQLKLQKAIYQNAGTFLHLHMLPLKSLPKILKHATPNGQSSSSTNITAGAATTAGAGAGAGGAGGRPPGALAAIRYNHMRNNSSSNISLSSVTSSRISEMEEEEKGLRERLIVLEEQKFMVTEMIADANKRRKFDEVAALTGNVDDLSTEIDGVQKMLDGLDWEGVYADRNGGGGGGGLGSGAATPPETREITRQERGRFGILGL